MEVRDFIEKIESGEAKVLTLEYAKTLIGKEVYWMFFGYHGNYNRVTKTRFGAIMTKKEYYTTIETDPVSGYSNRYEYWKAEEKRFAAEAETTHIILDENNKLTYIECYKNNRYFDEETFTCSDEDREVWVLEIE